MALRVELRPSGILIPIDDLKVRDLPNRNLILGEDLAMVLGLNLGWDGKQSRLMLVDANGNLRVALGGASGGVFLTDNVGTLVNIAASMDGQPANSSQRGVEVNALLQGVDGTTIRQVKVASAAELATQLSTRALMTAPPGNWDASSNPAAGTAASASRAAGGAGVRHVCKSITIILSATTALAGITTVTINVRDGASGAGTILESYQVTIPAATLYPLPINIPDLNLVGTANTAMTVEGSAAVGNLMESISFRGTDAS